MLNQGFINFKKNATYREAPCRRPFRSESVPIQHLSITVMFFKREAGSCHFIQSAIRCPCWSRGCRAASRRPLPTTPHHFSAFIDRFARLNVGKKGTRTYSYRAPPHPPVFMSPFLLILPLCVEPRVISMWSTLSVSSRHIKLAEGGVGFSLFRIGSRLVCRYTSSSVKATPRQS